MTPRLASAAALAAALGAAAALPAAAQPYGNPNYEVRIRCESRDYRQEFCGTNERVLSARLVRQNSRAQCILGRTWGWRGHGIWVSDGCEGEFAIRTESRPYPPAPPGRDVAYCESREYRYNFCSTGRIRNAQLVEQRSSAPCVQGRSWGWQRDGIWVDNGCVGVFRIRRD